MVSWYVGGLGTCRLSKARRLAGGNASRNSRFSCGPGMGLKSRNAPRSPPARPQYVTEYRSPKVPVLVSQHVPTHRPFAQHMRYANQIEEGTLVTCSVVIVHNTCHQRQYLEPENKRKPHQFTAARLHAYYKTPPQNRTPPCTSAMRSPRSAIPRQPSFTPPPPSPCQKYSKPFAWPYNGCRSRFKDGDQK